MDRLSLAETMQNRLKMRRQGLLLPGHASACEDLPYKVAQENLAILTGRAGWETLAEYQSMLLTPAGAQLWNTDLGVYKEQCLSLMLLAIGDGFRRLILPFESMPYQLFRLVHGNLDEAKALAVSLQQQNADCLCCSDPLFAKVFLDCVLDPGIQAEHQIRRLERLRVVLLDVPQDVPASSVEVERCHANLQTDCATQHQVPKRPYTVQSDSYVAQLVVAYNALHRQLELEVFGSNGKHRLKRVLQNRRLEAAAPAFGLSLRARRLNADGTVKGRTGLLKGILRDPQLCTTCC